MSDDGSDDSDIPGLAAASGTDSSEDEGPPPRSQPPEPPPSTRRPAAEAIDPLVGCHVRVTGVTTAAELNGRIGRCDAFLTDSDRYQVELAMANGTTVVRAFRRSNLIEVSPAEVAAQATADADARARLQAEEEERRREAVLRREQEEAARRLAEERRQAEAEEKRVAMIAQREQELRALVDALHEARISGSGDAASASTAPAVGWDSALLHDGHASLGEHAPKRPAGLATRDSGPPRAPPGALRWTGC